jgi:patatin-like phospholipase/acyl hydrolase
MPGKHLKLLCLDGGGIRSLSSLYILQKLMENIDPDAASPLKPCDYFDIIGGTSTGGLIAIMLGRLEMDVVSCIEWFIHLSKVIFARKARLPFTMTGKVHARFKSEILRDAMQDIVIQQGFDKDERLKKPEGRCKV